MLGIVYRVIAGHLVKKAGETQERARSGAATLIQRFENALNLNIHFHMLFVDGVYVEERVRLRFRRVKAPERAELEALVQSLTERVGRHLERQGLLARDAENGYLALEPQRSPRESRGSSQDARMHARDRGGQGTLRRLAGKRAGDAEESRSERRPRPGSGGGRPADDKRPSGHGAEGHAPHQGGDSHGR